MIKIDPYLTFNGNTEEAFNFYKSVFGKDFSAMQKFKDMPGSDKMSAKDLERVMHVALPINEQVNLMASDNVESMEKGFIVGNNFSISINTDSKDEADKLFNELSEGGKVEVALADSFWGAYFGMFQDKFGINWIINHDYNRNSK